MGGEVSQKRERGSKGENAEVKGNMNYACGNEIRVNGQNPAFEVYPRPG